MKIRTAIPWLSLLVAVIAVLNPVGMDFLSSSFSSERLSRDIARPIVLMVLAALALLALVECLVRFVLIRRSRRQT